MSYCRRLELRHRLAARLEHHYGILIAMFAATFAPTVASTRLGAGSLVLLAAAYVLAANVWRITNELADTPLNFMQSYLFFGAVLMLIHLYRLRHAES
jgi:intracellular septation protein A